MKTVDDSYLGSSDEVWFIYFIISAEILYFNSILQAGKKMEIKISNMRIGHLEVL